MIAKFFTQPNVHKCLKCYITAILKQWFTYCQHKEKSIEFWNFGSERYQAMRLHNDFCHHLKVKSFHFQLLTKNHSNVKKLRIKRYILRKNKATKTISILVFMYIALKMPFFIMKELIFQDFLVYWKRAPSCFGVWSMHAFTCVFYHMYVRCTFYLPGLT